MEKKEAMEILRKHYSNAPFSERTALETFIPELAEGEDERIRKTLIRLFTANNVEDYGEVTNKQIIAWLEKQGKEKPVEWSEEDKINLIYTKCIIDEIWHNQYVREEIGRSSEELELLWHWLDNIWQRVEYPQNTMTTISTPTMR